MEQIDVQYDIPALQVLTIHQRVLLNTMEFYLLYLLILNLKYCMIQQKLFNLKIKHQALVLMKLQWMYLKGMEIRMKVMKK